jgi:RNA exonuclease 4
MKMLSKDSNSEPLKKKLKKENENKNEGVFLDLNSCSSNWKKCVEYSKKKKVVENTPKKQEIWFDVDHIFIEKNEQKIKETNGSSNKEISKDENISNKKESVEADAKLTKAIAIDCEMVGVGEDGRDSILARVSLVNQLNQCIYDKFVQPTEHVIDYRTHVSGVRADDLKKSNGAEKFEVVQREVAEMIKDRILVGHAIHNDLKILFLDHPKKKLRDTQRCKLFRKLKPSLGGIPSLKNLAQALLGVSIQCGEHSSVQDAQAAMRIYTMYRKQWEMEVRNVKIKEKKQEPDDLVLKQSIIKSGNERHKKYIENKLRGRKPLNFKRK